METIVWIFQKVMPWIGVYFTAMTIIFLVLFIIDLLHKKRYISDHMDVTGIAFDVSIIVNIIPMILIKLISWLIEKAMERLELKTKLRKEKA